jgi:hypothetical protein
MDRFDKKKITGDKAPPQVYQEIFNTYKEDWPKAKKYRQTGYQYVAADIDVYLAKWDESDD